MTMLPPETRPDGLVWESVCDSTERWTWRHYDLVHAASHGSIEAIGALPEDARDLLMDGDDTVRLEVDGQTVFGVLPGFGGRPDDDEEFDVKPWRFAVRPGLIVTSRRAPVTSLGKAYRFLEEGGRLESPAGLIGRAIRDFTDTVRRETAVLSERLDDAEDTLLDGERGEIGALGPIIGVARRRATRLRRVMAPLHRTFHDDELRLPDWEIEEICERAQREIHIASDDLNALQDRARSLQDELSARQAGQANDRLYIVSVVTALMLPATFVTGFFGMNTGGMFLAGGHGHAGTVTAAILCVLSLLAMFGFLKLRKLL